VDALVGLQWAKEAQMTDISDAYFRVGDEQIEIDENFPPVYTSIDDIPFVTLAEGVRARPVFGKNLLVNYVYFEPNKVAPVHQHAEEQVGTALEGEFEFELNGKKQIIKPGVFYFVPPNVPHGARSLDKACIAVDIFSPPRSGIREMLERAKAENAG
jgi:quercetin dioxygenase-like cupin family protein